MTQASDTPGCAVKRQQRPGLQVVTVSRQTLNEIFITAVPVEGEPPEAVFGKVASVLAEHKASVVAQDVFGIPDADGSGTKALAEAVGDLTWPVTWLEGSPDVPRSVSGTHVWAVSGVPVQSLEQDGTLIGRTFADDYAEYCRIGGLVPRDVSQAPAAQSTEVFERMLRALAGVDMDFHNVLRTWFYNCDILSWYGEFNAVRDGFFKEWRVFDGLVPASTGMGGINPAGAALTSGLLAVRPKTVFLPTCMVPSPLQCPALEYGSSFSRATSMVLPDLERLFVSGTASIAPEGHTVHLDDTDGQIALTMDVVHAILESRGMGWDDVTRAAAYFKRPEDDGAFAKYCESHGLQDFAAVPMNDDVCRGDLLFEIELDAVRARG
jgi:enamine deaminase RidA (YjgF/YER057c/UK114 family)